ncbi:hypothetical protein [Shimia abyssi]|uniref:Uncharacterized protein n=1 Tax=Shimia abyssi TaxID=1662395 RepID=A0A2P8FCK5_9RHOB|nr:hypothetical protein [Shimia abyssi]PSL19444.1 hypothetical protein CLV88_106157 [Shimia abyssi]
MSLLLATHLGDTLLMEPALQHVPSSALVPTTRHARLFELIRQENVAHDRAAHAPEREPNTLVTEHLKALATASLRRKV